jgi:hypothetical protein
VRSITGFPIPLITATGVFSHLFPLSVYFSEKCNPRLSSCDKSQGFVINLRAMWVLPSFNFLGITV